MAIEDGLCLATCIADVPATMRRRSGVTRRRGYLRTARVTLESRYLWDVYHSGGITRDVYFQMLGERTEADTFQCLAWLYDGVGPDGERHPAQSPRRPRFGLPRWRSRPHG